MRERPGIRILTTCSDDGVVRRAAAAFDRSAAVDRVGVDTIRRLGPAECLVVDASDHARIARATGFEGAIVVIGVARNEEELAAFLSQGTHFAPAADGADGVAEAFSTAIPRNGDGSPKAVEPSVARMRRLIAAGEIAADLRHAFNNPLTALMAELQLLQMDAREPQTRAAVERMLELVRRLTEVSRALESVNDRPPGM